MVFQDRNTNTILLLDDCKVFFWFPSSFIDGLALFLFQTKNFIQEEKNETFISPNKQYRQLSEIRSRWHEDWQYFTAGLVNRHKSAKNEIVFSERASSSDR